MTLACISFFGEMAGNLARPPRIFAIFCEGGRLAGTQAFIEARFGKLELRKLSFAHVGSEWPQAGDYSVRLTQAEFSPK